MKPACQFDPPKLSGPARAELRAAKRQFPRTAYFFQSGIGEWRGYWSPYDGENGSGFRNFRSLSREYFTAKRAKSSAGNYSSKDRCGETPQPARETRALPFDNALAFPNFTQSIVDLARAVFNFARTASA